MSEYMVKNERTHHEQRRSRHESQAHHERAEKQRQQTARTAEKAKVTDETIRRDVESQAISSTEYHNPQAEQRQHTPPLSRLDKEHGFETIMHQVRNEMKGPERRFSSFIHHPTIEKTSNIIGKTVARPSGVIGATIAASVGLLSLYGVAKFAGFKLSGSEVPILLGIGYVVGLFWEWCFKSIRVVFRKNPRIP